MTVTRPLVSVLLPTHNGKSRNIRRAIKSVLKQSYNKLELIIINDGSTDGTERLIAEIAGKDNRIKILSNKENKGIAYSLNKGLKIAKGTYIARIDDDDYYYDEDKTRKQVNFLEKNKEYVAVGSFFCDDSGNCLKRASLPIRDEEIRRKVPRRSIFLAVPFLCHGAMMFRRDTLNVAKKVYEPYYRCEDLDLKLFLATKGKLYNIPEYFYVRSRTYPRRDHRKTMFMNQLNLMRKYKDQLGFTTMDFVYKSFYYFVTRIFDFFIPDNIKQHFKRSLVYKLFAFSHVMIN